MTSASTLVTTLPLVDDDDPFCWIIGADDAVQQRPLSTLSDVFEPSELEAMPMVVLMPADCSTYCRAEPRGLEPQQEIAVARIDAQEKAIGAVQAAASLDADGRLMTATVDSAYLINLVQRFWDVGLNPVAIVPIGAALKPVGAEVVRSSINGHTTLHAADICCADEPGLAAAFFGDADIRTAEEPEIAAALVAIAMAPVPNFLDGLSIRKKQPPILTELQKLWAKRLLLLAVALFLTGSVVYYARLHWAIYSEDQAALALAQSVAPTVTDVMQAEAAVNAAIARKGIERAKPVMLLAIVWQSVRTSDNLALTDATLGDDGLLKATLSAPDTESINAALLSIERAGYQITATPRRDQSGTILADLTLRAP